VKGDVVIVPFPFSDLSQAKKRPAFVVTVLDGDDIILCQITSQWVKDKYAIPIDEDDFATGSLKQKSHIRPNRIFTADRNIILYPAGRLHQKKIDDVMEQIVKILYQ